MLWRRRSPAAELPAAPNPRPALPFMAKTLCDWDRKDIRKHADRLLAIVTPQRFLCSRCARTACGKRYLCHPVSMKRLRREAGFEVDGDGDDDGDDGDC